MEDDHGYSPGRECGEYLGQLPGLRNFKVASNVFRADYAGSEACSGCHADIFEERSQSPMHRMTRPAERSEVRAPFAGETFEFKGDVAQMVTSSGQRLVSFIFTDGNSSRYRVTRIIGGRYREDFVGVDARHRGCRRSTKR